MYACTSNEKVIISFNLAFLICGLCNEWKFNFSIEFPSVLNFIKLFKVT